MADIIRKDESVLTDKEQGVLSRLLEKLEQFYPEHKVYAMDALCAQQRETSAKYAIHLKATAHTQCILEKLLFQDTLIQSLQKTLMLN